MQLLFTIAAWIISGYVTFFEKGDIDTIWWVTGVAFFAASSFTFLFMIAAFGLAAWLMRKAGF